MRKNNAAITLSHASQRLCRLRQRRASGFVIVYVLLAWTVLIGVCSLAVDYGHVCFVKTQLQCTADAAAHAALFNLPLGLAASQNAAITIAAANRVDGSPQVITSSNIVYGTWNSSTQTFTVLTGAAQSTATAVQVNVQHAASTKNAVQLLFAAIIGQATCDVHASGIANMATGCTVTNASFETPVLGYGGYTYNVAMPGWTLTGTACLEDYHSAWTGPQPAGQQALSLQGANNQLGTITQTFSATAGIYSISFLAAQRTSYYIGGSALQPVSVKVDGTQVALVSPTTGTFKTYSTPTFTLAGGTHTLSMSSTTVTSTSDSTTFVDSVAINASASNVVLAQ